MTAPSSPPDTTTPEVHVVTALDVYDPTAGRSALEIYYASGDLSGFTGKQRIGLLFALCEQHGLTTDAWTWMTNDRGKIILYPNAKCAEQLRRRHQISIEPVRKEQVGDLFVVELKGHTPSGRTDVASKYVSVKDKYGHWLAGQALADAYAKCETGAKRRLTFSLVGMSTPLDVSDERPTGLHPVIVAATGSVVEHPTEEQRHLAEHPRVATVLGAPAYADTASAADSPVHVASTLPTAAELARPVRDPNVPRPTFGMDEKRALGAWFSIVPGTYLADDAARHAFVLAWTTARWPAAARTESLKTFFRRATEPQAQEFLAHVRGICEIELANAKRPPQVTEPDPEPQPEPAPVGITDWPDVLALNARYTRAELFAAYDAWAAFMRRLDTTFVPDDVTRLADTVLRRTVEDLIALAESTAEYLAQQSPDDDDDEPVEER